MMTIAEKGFFLAYIDDSLSKTAHSDPPRKKKRKGAGMAIAAGALAGGGLSVIWGKLSNNPDIVRDLLMSAAAGTSIGVGMYGGSDETNKNKDNSKESV